MEPEKKDIYILNRAAVKRLVNEQKGRAKKTLACGFITDQTGIDQGVLYNKVNICNENTRTVPFFVAVGLRGGSAAYFEGEPYDFSDFILDVRRTIILISTTGTSLYGTNEKIILTMMLLYYEEKEWWSVKDILDFSIDSGSNALKENAIRESFDYACGDKKSKNHHIFVEKKDDQYRLDIDAIIKYITQSKKVNQTASKILT
jgi:hypothetical protein